MTELKGTGRGAAILLSQTIITDGNWHRIGLVWDGSNRTLYVDDVAVAEDIQDNLKTSENVLYIGTGKAMEAGSFWSGLIAVGPTVDMGGWKLYGGPFYYYLSGDLDVKGTFTAPGFGSSRWKASGDLEADSNVGGFVGGQFTLTGNCDMTTELSFTGDSWAIGTGIVWKF